MEQFPGNSHSDKEKKKARPEGKPSDVDKKLEKVVEGEVSQRKKPMGRRFKDVFIGGEFKSAAHYIAVEVLLPAARNAVVDGVTKGIERVIYGESSIRRSDPRHTQSRTVYNSPVNRSGTQRANLPDQPRALARNQDREVGEILLQTRADAERVLETLIDIVNQYDVASVADLNELLGFSSAFTDNRWGWVNLSYADIRQTRNGFLLILPPAEVI
jgi:hypothetical protein